MSEFFPPIETLSYADRVWRASFQLECIAHDRIIYVPHDHAESIVVVYPGDSDDYEVSATFDYWLSGGYPGALPRVTTTVTTTEDNNGKRTETIRLMNDHLAHNEEMPHINGRVAAGHMACRLETMVAQLESGNNRVGLTINGVSIV